MCAKTPNRGCGRVLAECQGTREQDDAALNGQGKIWEKVIFKGRHGYKKKRVMQTWDCKPPEVENSSLYLRKRKGSAY